MEGHNHWLYDVIGAAVVAVLLFENERRIEADLMRGIPPAWWRKHLFLLISLPVIAVVGGAYLVASFALGAGSGIFALVVLGIVAVVIKNGYQHAEAMYLDWQAQARMLREQQSD